ncbi:hypothetical protein AXK60_08615 [Tsukamurella pseudospumae]|uniref:Uncharacterized protein n=2 Tax=Tsukamurella pseudospumae TaxID=239498 RepID=A0A138AEC9_9ACTN|nr:hypothetical protein AXK60_08615 [Tsukamurella pseudospumae]
MEDEQNESPSLPGWVEDYFAEQRAYWTALRDGGALTPDQERESIRRAVRGLVGDNEAQS